MYYNEVKVAHHEHTLQLVCLNIPFICNGCKEVGYGARYECGYAECNYQLHKDCVSAFVDKQTVPNPFHPRREHSIFLQQPTQSSRCDACARDIQGFVYHQFDRGWDFHPTCANLKNHLDIDTHDGDHMALTLTEKLSSKCHKCGMKELRKGISSWAYVSNCKKYQFHVYCVKDMMLESLEESLCEYGCYGDGSSAIVSNSQAVVTRPKIQIVADKEKRKKKGGKYAVLKKIARIAISFIMAALVGNPTSFVASLIEAVISD